MIITNSESPIVVVLRYSLFIFREALFVFYEESNEVHSRFACSFWGCGRTISASFYIHLIYLDNNRFL